LVIGGEEAQRRNSRRGRRKGEASAVYLLFLSAEEIREKMKNTALPYHFQEVISGGRDVERKDRSVNVRGRFRRIVEQGEVATC